VGLRPKVCPRPRPLPQRGYVLLVVFWNRASIYIGFWRWALGILQYPSRKRILYFQRRSRRKKVTEGPGPPLGLLTEVVEMVVDNGQVRTRVLQQL